MHRNTATIKTTFRGVLAVALASGIAPVAHAADTATSVAAPNPAIVRNSATADEAAIARWREFGYGMFIHFGMSTFVGNEYGTGKELSTAYVPTALDVDQWVRVAHNARMKYAVLTAKHVAGHCLWDSKVQFRGKEFDHDVATSSCKTDVVAEFVKACKKYDVAPGLYWCLLDRRNNTDMDAKSLEQTANAKKTKKKAGLNDDFFQLAKDQFAELIQRYPEVGYYWIDIPRAATAAERQEMYDLIKRLRPGTVVLFNHGAGKPGGQMTIATAQAAWPTDVLGTERYPLNPCWFKPEHTWKGNTYHLVYELCETIHKRWFWFPNDGPRPAKELYNLFQSVHAAGGNFLLNVPPDKTGRIPEADIKALMEVKQLIDDRAARPNPLNAGPLFDK